MLRTDGQVHSAVPQHVPKLCFCPQPHTPLFSHNGFTASPGLAYQTSALGLCVSHVLILWGFLAPLGSTHSKVRPA